MSWLAKGCWSAGRDEELRWQALFHRPKLQRQETIRRANLVNRMEATLLEALTAGYDLNEISQAMDLAMDRWRTLSAVPSRTVR